MPPLSDQLNWERNNLVSRNHDHISLPRNVTSDKGYPSFRATYSVQSMSLLRDFSMTLLGDFQFSDILGRIMEIKSKSLPFPSSFKNNPSLSMTKLFRKAENRNEPFTATRLATTW